MDFLQKIGGRKFIMALIVVGAACALEVKSPNGLTPTMATFLGSIVAAFSAANYMATSKHMDSRSGGKSDVSSQLDTISDQIKQANDPETIAKLTDLLTNIHNKLSAVENVSGQVGGAVLNLTNQVSVLSKKLS
jgi:hypothetical protein